MASLSSLPNELLCTIFAFYAMGARSRYNLGLLGLMLVCRGWHDLVLGYHRLWSSIQISFGDLHRLLGQIDHSGQAPLTITFWSYDSPHFTDALLKSRHRLRDLEINGHERPILDVVHQLSNYDLPILERLSLSPSDSTPGVEFPDQLFQRAPRLASLVLRNVLLRWSSLHNLADLTLWSCPESSTCAPPSFQLLCSTLRASPGLRNLNLAGVVEMTDSALEMVYLPVLQSLHISDSAASCAQLLNHLAFPATVSLALYANDVAAASPLFTPLRRHLRMADAPSLHFLKIQRISQNFLALSAGHCVDSDTHLYISCTPPNESHAHALILAFLDLLPAITHLDAGHALYVPRTSWGGIHPLLPTLHTLSLQLNAATQHLCGALQLLGNPRITSIRLVASTPNPGARDALLTFVRNSAARGCMISRLDIVEKKNCIGMGEDEWAELADSVGALSRRF
ncbi:hypothetical protein FB45DRAFT_253219 [Roridomyces roridus]|uniref:F-box domain-containing protein n=1 Tax=Roridomyces roridus TaxID=1738132 RepID=A0AAD7B9Z5_9AGAR|nr:hypothetical protein FB45DRAFT_253219 [Roridomyces roridus]